MADDLSDSCSIIDTRLQNRMTICNDITLTRLKTMNKNYQVRNCSAIFKRL